MSKKTTIVPQYSEEQIEAMRLEGIVAIDPKDGRIDLVRQYLDLREKKGKLEAEMKAISALFKEEAAQEDIRELHYNGSKVVNVGTKVSRSADYNVLQKDYPEAYEAAVKETESVVVTFSKIKE